VLSTRLTKFEEAGIVERRIPPAPQRGVVYGLTEAGAKFEIGRARISPLRAGAAGRCAARRDRRSVDVGINTQGHVKHPGGTGTERPLRDPNGDIALYAVVADGVLTTGVGPAPGA
jgi:hypothetical protein